MYLFFNVPKYTSTFFLVIISLCSVAQKQSGSVEKIGLRNVLSHISYIPPKSFTSLDHTGTDSVSSYGKKIVAVHGFYISQTEVTNVEYREFVFYVRDSIAHRLLSHFRNGTDSIDWTKPINWNDKLLDTLIIPPEERVFGRKEIDPNKIVYEIDFFGKKEVVSVYPDTLVWMQDFSNSYNESLAKNYFSHSSYDNYPVVGINLKQAMAFCRWKTEETASSVKGPAADTLNMLIRLPSSEEWESAAYEIKDTAGVQPDNKQCNCNSAVMAGKDGTTMKGIKDDGYLFTSPIKSFPPGPNGLFDMKGNVAEWTSTARDEIMDVEVKPEKQKTFFIVKGGGWNSTPFYLQPGVCQFFSADDTHSFIGFRYVVYVERKLKGDSIKQD